MRFFNRKRIFFLVLVVFLLLISIVFWQFYLYPSFVRSEINRALLAEEELINNTELLPIISDDIPPRNVIEKDQLSANIKAPIVYKGENKERNKLGANLFPYIIYKEKFPVGVGAVRIIDKEGQKHIFLVGGSFKSWVDVPGERTSDKYVLVEDPHGKWSMVGRVLFEPNKLSDDTRNLTSLAVFNLSRNPKETSEDAIYWSLDNINKWSFSELNNLIRPGDFVALAFQIDQNDRIVKDENGVSAVRWLTIVRTDVGELEDLERALDKKITWFWTKTF